MRKMNYIGFIVWKNGCVESRWFASKRKAKRWVYTRPAEKAWTCDHDPLVKDWYTPVRVWVTDKNNNTIWYKER